jgi:hypothetical protein
MTGAWAARTAMSGAAAKACAALPLDGGGLAAAPAAAGRAALR